MNKRQMKEQMRFRRAAAELGFSDCFISGDGVIVCMGAAKMMIGG